MEQNAGLSWKKNLNFRDGRFLFINNQVCFTLWFGFFFKEEKKKPLEKFQERPVFSCASFLNIYPNFFWS